MGSNPIGIGTCQRAVRVAVTQGEATEGWSVRGRCRVMIRQDSAKLESCGCAGVSGSRRDCTCGTCLLSPSNTWVVSPSSTCLVSPSSTRLASPSSTCLVRPSSTCLVRPSSTCLVSPSSTCLVRHSCHPARPARAPTELDTAAAVGVSRRSG